MIDATAIATEIDAIDYSVVSIRPEFIDGNGHLNVGYYALLFDKALDLPWARLGIYSGLILASGYSSFALETHMTYQRELKLGDPLDFSLLLLDFDAKRIHYFLTMRHRHERWVAATCEQISTCVDMNARRSTAWPREALARITALHGAHRARPRPPEVGRAIGIRRRAEPGIGKS
jgi:acyl-CoA thioester hydrolase